MIESEQVILTIFAMLIMSIGIILFVVLYQRKVIKHQHDLEVIRVKNELDLLKATIKGEEEERSRIAGELHDDVGSCLAAISLSLHRVITTNTDERLIIETGLLIDGVLDKIRMISHKLQPNALFAIGLVPALQNYFDSINNLGGINILFKFELSRNQMTGLNELHLYRIVQELVTNINKYAQASKIEVIFRNELFVEILLTHDGMGLENDNYSRLLLKPNGIGLKNVESRIRLLQGSINFKKKESREYTIEIKYPLTQN
jgi:signal transduction histidine kinase